jgi:hypothetical protein
MWSYRRVGRLWQIMTPTGPQPTLYPDAITAAAALTDAWRSAITAATAPPIPGGTPFFAVLGFEGAETSDRRVFDSLTWRELPLPLSCQFQTDEGHDGAQVVGRIDAITRDGNRILATGFYDTTEEAQRALHLAEQRMAYGVSMDMSGGGAFPTFECMGYDADGWCNAERARFPSAEIMQATQVATPAFPGAQIALDDFPATSAEPAAPAPEPPVMDDVPEDAEVVFLFSDDGQAASAPADCPECQEAVAAAAAPVRPPQAWFTMPEPATLTPWTVLDNGQVFGHIAAWDSCHTGDSTRCTRPPRSAAAYAYFHTGEVVCAGGERLPVGRVSLGGGHAPTDGRTPQATLAHYDDTTTCVADVRAIDGQFGVWVCGAQRPSLTDEQRRELSASPPSGDWRRIAGSLELLHVLCVNAPGFPIARALVASAQRPDEVHALVAAGAQQLAAEVREPWRGEVRALQAQVETLTRQVRGHARLLDVAAPQLGDQLVASVAAVG